MFGIFPFCEGCLLILHDLGSFFFFSKIKIGQCKICPVNRTIDGNNLIRRNLLKHRKSSCIVLLTAQGCCVVDSQKLTQGFGTHIVQKLMNLLDVKVRVTIQSRGQITDFSKKLFLPQKINQQRTNQNKGDPSPVDNLSDGSLKVKGRNHNSHKKASENQHSEIDNSNSTMMFFHDVLLFDIF